MSERRFQLYPAAPADDSVAASNAGRVVRADLHRDVRALQWSLPPADPGRHWLVSCEDRYHLAVATLAVWSAGVAVALPPNRRPSTIRACLQDASVIGHLTDDSELEGIDVRPVLESAVNGADAPASTGPWVFDGNRHLATVFTSGSTGGHRDWPKTAAQLLGEASVLVDVFGLTDGCRVLATVPSHHIYGLLFGWLVPAVAGGVFVRETPLHAETVAALVERHGADVLVSTPSHLRALSALEPGSLSGVRQVFSSGAPLHWATAEMLQQRFGLVVTEVLGSTETGGIGWRQRNGRLEDPSWMPLPGVEVAPDPHGRLLLSSPFLPPTERRPRVCDDRVSVDADGRFRHLGRFDDVVKVAGKRVSLGELERRILEIPGVADGVVSVRHGHGGRAPRIRAAVVAPNLEVEVVRRGLLQWFDPVVIPKRILMVERLPREETGKLAKDRLDRLFDGPEQQFEFGRPRPDGADDHIVSVHVPEGLAFFRGHFPGQAILPGVAQLDGIVLSHVRGRWPDLGRLQRVVRLKFKQTIGPGDDLMLRVARKAPQKVVFELFRGQQPCASGTLIFVQSRAS